MKNPLRKILLPGGVLGLHPGPGKTLVESIAPKFGEPNQLLQEDPTHAAQASSLENILIEQHVRENTLIPQTSSNICP